MKYAAAIAKGIIKTRTGTWRLGKTDTYIETSCSVCGEQCFVRKYLADRGVAAICGQSCNGVRKTKAHTGATHKQRGYVVVHRPDHPMSDKAGKLLEHRLIMSEHLGRLLEAHEVVHHKDGNRSNNAIENLELLQSHKEHAAVHAKESELYQLHKKGLLRCSSCRTIKPFAAFDEGKTMRYGHKNQCKECRAEAYRKANPDTRPHDVVMRERHHAKWVNSEHYKLFTAGKKICRKCDETKELSCFSPYKLNKDGLMSYCKDCRNAISRTVKRDREVH